MNLLDHEITDESFLLGLIPQRKPFVMIDKLVHYSEKKIISGFTVSKESILTTEGYFSAAGLIENMAQTVALHTGYKYYLAHKPAPKGYIGAIKTAEVLALPKVTQELRTSITIIHDIMNVTLVEAEVLCEGQVMARSQMKTALAPS